MEELQGKPSSLSPASSLRFLPQTTYPQGLKSRHFQEEPTKSCVTCCPCPLHIYAHSPLNHFCKLTSSLSLRCLWSELNNLSH